MMGAPWFPRSKKVHNRRTAADTAATLVSGGLKKTRNVPVLIGSVHHHNMTKRSLSRGSLVRRSPPRCAGTLYRAAAAAAERNQAENPVILPLLLALHACPSRRLLNSDERARG